MRFDTPPPRNNVPARRPPPGTLVRAIGPYKGACRRIQLVRCKPANWPRPPRTDSSGRVTKNESKRPGGTPGFLLQQSRSRDAAQAAEARMSTRPWETGAKDGFGLVVDRGIRWRRAHGFPAHRSVARGR